jgi:hypothetical protein
MYSPMNSHYNIIAAARWSMAVTLMIAELGGAGCIGGNPLRSSDAGAPLPSDANSSSLAGTVRWVDNCLREGKGLSGGRHIITGTNSTPRINLTCAVGISGSDLHVELRASVGDSLDLSTEAVVMSADFGSAGQAARNGGSMAVRGLNWSVARAPLVGEFSMYPCYAVLDRLDLTSRSFAGRFRCRDLRDNSTVPPRICQIGGQAGFTAVSDWADFEFANCSVP